MALQGMAVHGSAATVVLTGAQADIVVQRDQSGTLLRGGSGGTCAVIFAVPTPTVRLGPDTGSNFRSLLRMVYLLWRPSGATLVRVTVNDGPNLVFVADVNEPDDAVHDGTIPLEFASTDSAYVDIEAVVQSNMRLGVSRWPVTSADGANPAVLWGIAVRADVLFDAPAGGQGEILITTAGADFTVPDE
jgi:hypothetical protein